MAAVEQILQPSQNELFFSRVPIFVEGSEDIAFIATYLKLIQKWEEFRKYGCHFVNCEGKNRMSRPLAIAQGLNIPYFAIFEEYKNGQTLAHQSSTFKGRAIREFLTRLLTKNSLLNS